MLGGDSPRDDDLGPSRVVFVVGKEEEEKEKKQITNVFDRERSLRRRTRRRAKAAEETVVRATARDGQKGFQAEDPMENSEHRW